jgi:hypothetical protein
MRWRTGFMFGLILVSRWTLLGQEEKSSPPKRDQQSVGILTRVLQNSGGSQALAAVHDITESGEITFYSGKGIKGPVKIQMLDGKHLRLEAALPGGKSVWVIREGVGSQIQGDTIEPISRQRAIALANFTFPVRHVIAALADGRTEISFVQIEKRHNRSLYRLRVKGQLSLLSEINSALLPLTKDLLIDALTFDIVSVEDFPLPLSKRYNRNPFVPAPHKIDFEDFRVINGVRVPFLIVNRTFGQVTLSLRLTDVTLNNNLGDRDFEW